MIIGKKCSFEETICRTGVKFFGPRNFFTLASGNYELVGNFETFKVVVTSSLTFNVTTVDFTILKDETEKNVDFYRDGDNKDEQLRIAVNNLFRGIIFVHKKVTEKISETTEEAVLLIVSDNDK